MGMSCWLVWFIVGCLVRGSLLLLVGGLWVLLLLSCWLV